MKFSIQPRQFFSSNSCQAFNRLYEQPDKHSFPEQLSLNSEHQIFGIVRDQQLIGSIVLDNNSSLHPIEVFAAPNNKESNNLLTRADDDQTNITYFWISKPSNQEMLIHRFTALSMIYAITRYTKAILILILSHVG